MPEQELPLVTVITPTYNRADYIVETVESVLTQDYPNVQYIVLDDGSQDDTLQRLEAYKDRLTLIAHKNMGEVPTLNKGYALAEGEFITIVNSDDPILPGYIRRMVDFFQAHPDLLGAYPRWEVIDEHGNTSYEHETLEYDYLTMLKMHKCLPGSGMMLRRAAFDLVPGRDPDFRYSADFNHWIQLGLHGPFQRVPEVLATWRVHPDSATAAKKGKLMADEHILLMDKLYEQADIRPEVLAIKNEAYANAYLIAATVMMETDNPAEANPYLWKAFTHQPALMWKMTGYMRGIVLKHLIPGPLYPALRGVYRGVAWLNTQRQRIFYKLGWAAKRA